MKFVLTGSLGHIGKPLTEILVQKGHAVTVISSTADRHVDIEALGATAAIGTIHDAQFLTNTFTGANAVYTMVPPPANIFDPALDVMAVCRTIGNNFAQAIEASGVRRVVHLSSIGAHLGDGVGLIHLHYLVEGILDKLTDVDLTFMRPTAFYYNLLGFIGGIKSTGTIASSYGGDVKIVWVSPLDIAIAIADELETSIVGRKVRYVASEERTCNEVAATLGSTIGQPDLKWVVISDKQMQSGLEAFGMPPQIAAGLVEMQSSMHDGPFFDDYYLNRPSVPGTVKLTDFAKEFAAAYHKQ